jgi:hypothetical protein
MSDTPAHRRFAAEACLTDLLCPRDDPAALADLLDRLLGNTQRLAAARAQAWDLGQKRFNWEMEKGSLFEAVEHVMRSGAMDGRWQLTDTPK